MTPLERLRKGRINLLLDEPFFGTLLMQLKPVLTDKCPTLSTDGRVLNVNPQWLAGLSDAELNTNLAHEVLHPALLHPYRRGSRDLKKFNVAADYVINNFLTAYNEHVTRQGGAAPFPFTGPMATGLLNPAYQGMSAEEIYSLLPAAPEGLGSGVSSLKPSGPPSSGQGPPQKTPDPRLQTPDSPSSLGQGQPTPGKGPPQKTPDSRLQTPDSASSPGEFTDGAADEAGNDEGEATWRIALQQAAQAGKARGRLPAEIARLVGEILEPKVHWRELLRHFLTAVAKDDYSFAKPNRRYSSSSSSSKFRVILPGLHSPKLGKIVVAVDTSGSIDAGQFTAFMAEAQQILFDCRPETFILAQCDARLHEWAEVDPFADLTLTEGKGGGGTSFVPVFERALEEIEPPVALIYLTDLDGTMPDYTPPFPVLWCVTGSKAAAPFGEVLNVQSQLHMI